MSNRNVIFSLEVVETFGSDESRVVELGGKFLSKGMVERDSELRPLFNAFLDHYNITSSEVLLVNSIISKAYKELESILRVE